MQFDSPQQLGTKSKCDHSVYTPFPLSDGVGGLSLLPDFQKRGGWGLTGSQFLEGVACKEGGDFFPGGELQFLLKNKLKYEIFDDKKSL